jgi:hypothetical protein
MCSAQGVLSLINDLFSLIKKNAQKYFLLLGGKQSSYLFSSAASGVSWDACIGNSLPTTTINVHF